MTLKLLVPALLVLLVGLGLWHSLKPLPDGLAWQSQPLPLENPELWTDTTRHFADGSSRIEHEIFDGIFRLIAQAEQFILLDMFLFNSTGPDDLPLRPLAQQTVDALVARKHARPDIDIIVITDPLNTFYGGSRSALFEQLEQAGIRLVTTRLTPLRDSNPAWSAVWRLCCQWLGNNPDGGWLANALGTEKATVRSYLALPNFKANHRKVVVADTGDGFRAVITSANPHDGSSRHSNIALAFGGPVVADVVRSERAVARLSGADTAIIDRWLARIQSISSPGPMQGSPKGQVLTESAIRDQALSMINRSRQGESIDLAMFYLSHRPIIEALIAAQHRGVGIRVLLDANKDAFGHEKNGIPNRPVANELHGTGIAVRWCNTHGEQCHSKLMLYNRADGKVELLAGSANFTRRNLDDLNLESDLWVVLDARHPVAAKAAAFFAQHWQPGPEGSPALSLPWAAWAESSPWRYWQYRVMEATGLSTF